MADTDPGEIIEPSEAPPEPIEFLVGSWSRFRVLNALGTTPRTRDDLMELTGVSRSTLSRILSDLTDRGWIVRRNDEYEATAKGVLVATEMEQLVSNIETAEELGAALEWLPPDMLGFDLAHLADATVLTPSPQDHTEPMRHITESISSTTNMRIVATGVTHKVVDAICRAGIAGDLTLHCVLDDGAFSGIRADADLREMFQEMIEAGHCEAYHYDGEDDLLDINLVDDAVMLCGHSDSGPPPGVVISSDDTVQTWAAVTFEMRRDESNPLDADAFTA